MRARIAVGASLLFAAGLLSACSDILGLDDAIVVEVPAVDGACTPGETRACYEGPDGTAEVGLCRSGTQVCLPHGRRFGPCEGQQLPAPDDCATPEDEDCDGVTTCGDTQWAVSLGSAANEAPLGVAAHPDGGAVIAGLYSQSMEELFLPAGNSLNAFVAKLDADGAVAWSHGMAGESSIVGRAVAVGPAGEVVVGIDFAGTVDNFGFGPIASHGSRDLLVVKIDADGTLVWAERFGGSGEEVVRAIDVAADGRIVLSGYFSDTTILGDATFEADAYDALVLSIAPDGAPLWAKRFGGPNDEFAMAVDLAAGGDAYVTGHFLEAIAFDADEPVASAGSRDVYLARLDAAGELVWAHTFGDEAEQRCYAVAARPSGGAVITPYGAGTVDFGGEPMPTLGTSDTFVASFDADGTHRFSRRFGGYSLTRAFGVDVDDQERIVVAGAYEGSVDFGAGPLPEASLNENPIFVLKLGGDGQLRFARGVPVVGEQRTSSVLNGFRTVRFDAQGSIFLAGFFERGELPIADPPLEPVGAADVFVAKLDP